MIEILDYITKGGTLNVVLFIILAIYVIIKISKDTYSWFRSFTDRKSSQMGRCDRHEQRISWLESAIRSINEKLDKLFEVKS